MKGFVYFVDVADRMALLPGEGDELRRVVGPVLCTGLRKSLSPSDSPGVLCYREGIDREILDAVGKDASFEWRPWGALLRAESGQLKEAAGAPMRVLMGFLPRLMPGPDDLRRATLFDGELRRLGDGRKWQVPSIMRSTRESLLPCAVGLDGEGRAVEVPLRRYRELSVRGVRVWEYVYGLLARCATDGGGGATQDDSAGMSLRESLQFVSEVLALNYLVGPVEVLALELLSGGEDGNIVKLLGSTVGFSRFLELEAATVALGKA